MKLLSKSHPVIQNISHDFNKCYYENNNIKYLKSERYSQIKHDNEDRQNFDDDAFKIIYNFKGDKLPAINHHIAHHLSYKLFLNKEPDISIVIEGQGNKRSWSVIKNNSMIDSELIINSGSIGHAMIFLAYHFKLQGHDLDLAGKVMGLQSYGNVDTEYLAYLKKFNINDIGILGNPIRIIDSENGLCSIKAYKKFKNTDKVNKLNWLKTLHTRFGEIILELFKKHCNPDDVIYYSGGVAQNVIWNTLLKEHFKNLVILPHCGDEGISFGGIQYLLEKENISSPDVSAYPFIQSDEAPSTEIQQNTIKKIAQHLANGKIVAYYQGHGEIGPRALGNRSILMDPRIPNGKDIINKIKNREYFRPFGASILEEYAKEYFDLDFPNPYMLYVGITQKQNLNAITHIDGTCRVQTVDKNFGHFRQLLEEFYNITNCPILLNTSLNNSGKPIAGWIRNAKEEFIIKDIDILVIGNELYLK